MPRLRFFLALLLLLPLAACDSTDDSATGTYAASSFTVAGQDVLAAGATLQMTLTDDGRVTGRFTIPEFLAEGEETDYSLAGTYTQDGSRVTFQQDADTFVRDATWTYQDDELRGSEGEVSVVLRRR